ncbi:MAG: hemerythrin domain-containing protein, partial [Actinomycetota bacterium]|nr:hemerythrin domain-containing protein [Actinomycetota bacterium]
MSEPDATSGAPVPLSEHSRVLIAVHQAMRADSVRLIGAVAALPDGDTERAERLGTAFSAIAGLIHDHHWTEDDVMYPFLLARISTFEDDAVRLEDDHVELDAAMARVGARFRLLAHQLSPRLWADTRDHLQDEVAALRQVLIDHLDREEAVVVPAFETALSTVDHRALRKQESKLATYRHMKMAIPWVLANATPQEEAELRATAPRLLGVVQDHVWEPRFRQVMAPLYGAPGEGPTSAARTAALPCATGCAGPPPARPKPAAPTWRPDWPASTAACCSPRASRRGPSRQECRRRPRAPLPCS